MYLEREKILLVLLVLNKLFVHLMVHLDLVSLWVVLLCPPLLTHGPLSYLVLALLLCVYTIIYVPLSFDWTIYDFMINIYFMVLLIKTFGPFILPYVYLWSFYSTLPWTTLSYRKSSPTL